MSNPIISILLPVYNQSPAYLRAALLSAKMQTYACEIIVVDDGSKPAQEEIVDAVLFSAGHQSAGYIYRWQENKGVAGALNKALSLSTGEFLQWLPSDDLFHPDKTKLQLWEMQKENAMVSYCAYEDGIPQAQNVWPAAQYPTREALFRALQQRPFINAVTLMWKREVFEQVGGWDEQMWFTQDTEHTLRCAERWNFTAINEPLVRRRTHPGQQTNDLKQEKNKQQKEREIAYINKRYGAEWKTWVPT